MFHKNSSHIMEFLVSQIIRNCLNSSICLKKMKPLFVLQSSLIIRAQLYWVVFFMVTWFTTIYYPINCTIHVLCPSFAFAIKSIFFQSVVRLKVEFFR
jgi:hypothetical protein